MANEQFAFLRSSQVPTREQWQQAIDLTKFDLKLYPEFEPRTDTGFVPCQLKGEDSGVETYFIQDPEFMQEFAQLAGDRDSCIAFRWGGDMRECACALIASYALAASFDAVVSYEGEPPHESLESFRSEIEMALKEI